MKKWKELSLNLDQERVLKLMAYYLKETEALEFSSLLSEYGTVESLLNCPEDGYVTHASPNWRDAKIENIVTF